MINWFKNGGEYHIWAGAICGFVCFGLLRWWGFPGGWEGMIWNNAAVFLIAAVWELVRLWPITVKSKYINIDWGPSTPDLRDVAGTVAGGFLFSLLQFT